MNGLHRIFIAVEIHSALHQAVAAAEAALETAGARIRWIRPSNLHFTLRFIGEIPMAQVALVKIATREAADGLPPFTITLRGLGAFPSLQRPQVVWVGVEEGAPQLETLASRVEARLVHYRFAAEERRFRPHLTLARVRDTRRWGDLVRALTQHKDVAIGSQEVDAVTIFESQLRRGGAIYTRVEEVRLLPHEK